MGDNNAAAKIPEVVGRLLAEAQALGFTMSSEPMVGCLLRTLAASKPGGSLLELGTGVGVGTAWLLAGMDANARLVTIENDPKAAGVARRFLSGDARATFVDADAAAWLPDQPAASFDFVFADAWAGKYSHLADALRLVKPGGIYCVDDMLPLPNWPPHPPNVQRFVAELEGRADLCFTRLDWATGIIIATRLSIPPA